ncbi:MAG: hypothetical protein ABJE95_09610 [Byssovorax sp.]
MSRDRFLRSTYLLTACFSALVAGCAGDSSDTEESVAGTDVALRAVLDTAAPPAVQTTCVHSSSLGKDYEVGPGKAYQSLNAVPWESLGPGDSVRVHWRATPYREKVLIANQGTATDPIVFCGIPDGPSGAPPILDGRGATSRPQVKFGPNPGQNSNVESAGVVIVFPGVHWYQQKPKYIVIAGLQVQGARTDPDPAKADFTDVAGKPRKYTTYSGKSGASAIYIWGAENVTVRGNVLTDSGNGLMALSQFDEKTTSRHLLIEGNDFHGNGNPGSYGTHNAYTEAIDIVYQYNSFGRLADGAEGDAIKDRSAGTVIRYNRIEPGEFMINLVDASSGNRDALVADPTYADSWIYGNVLIDRPNPNTAVFPGGIGFITNGVYWSSALSHAIVHYGGDSGNVAYYRRGTLHFYANTVVIQADASQNAPVSLFQLTNDPTKPAGTVDLRNNVVFRAARSPQAAPVAVTLTDSGLAPWTLGAFVLGPSWMSTGISLNPVKPFQTPLVITQAPIWGGPQNAPGFTNLSTYDTRPLAGSALIDNAGPLDALAAAHYPVLAEYVAPSNGAPRTQHGSMMDLGAFEGP